MPSFIKCLALLAIAATGVVAAPAPQGNSQCAHWCHDNWQTCPAFKNQGACVSYAAHNGFVCGCPAPVTPPPPPPTCPSGEHYDSTKGCCVSDW